MPKVQFEISEKELDSAAQSRIKELNKTIHTLQKTISRLEEMRAEDIHEINRLRSVLSKSVKAMEVLGDLKEVLESIITDD